MNPFQYHRDDKIVTHHRVRAATYSLDQLQCNLDHAIEHGDADDVVRAAEALAEEQFAYEHGCAVTTRGVEFLPDFGRLYVDLTIDRLAEQVYQEGATA